jgi:hypothetical protein
MACVIIDQHLLLGSFITKARGIMFYDVTSIRVGAPLIVRLDPYNPFDINCVELFSAGRKLGHLSKEAACVIAPLKRQGLQLKAWITSTSYSESMCRSWRFRVCDILVHILGEEKLFPIVKSALSDKKFRNLQFMKRVSEERSVLQQCADEEVDSDTSTETLSTHRQTHENDPVDSEATILYDYKVYMESDCSSTETLDSSCSQGQS